MIVTQFPRLWEALFDEPLTDRQAPATDEIMQFLAQYNDARGIAGQPESWSPDPALIADCRSAISSLPALVQAHLEPRLLGVFYAAGIGLSAVTDFIAYPNGDILGAVVIVDAGMLGDLGANAWASERDGTAFSDDPRIKLELRIARDGENDRAALLQYLLLHEFGYVLASVGDAMPNWWEPKITPSPAGAVRFIDTSWRVDAAGVAHVREKEDFPLRSQIRLGLTPRLPALASLDIYRALDATRFPTLCAATNPHEDFAESFANYVHQCLLGKPYETRIYRDGEMAFASGEFWNEPRAAAKRRFLDTLLVGAPEPFPRREHHSRTAALCRAMIESASSAYLGLAPYLRLGAAGGDLRSIAQDLLARAVQDESNANLWMNLANAFFSIGERELGLGMQEQTLARCRTFHLAAGSQPARGRALVLMAPGDIAENTPIDCLLDTGSIELIVHYVSPDQPLPPTQPDHDVVLVALSDTDDSRHLLDIVGEALADWPKPIVNRPRSIPNVERNRVSQLLQGVPGLAMPLTHEISREQLDAIADGDLDLADIDAALSFPIILRPVGSHAGKNLERIEGVEGVLAYRDAVASQRFYISRFIDYSGADGQFRKYRIALVDGQSFAGHMAISTHWMIHYVNAGMYEDADKRAEEAAFMRDYDRFAQRHEMALTAIHERCGLDYVCIDCAESQSGDLLIFEVDHAMVVHAADPEDLFPYKQVQVAKIRTAMEDLLCRGPDRAS